MDMKNLKEVTIDNPWFWVNVIYVIYVILLFILYGTQQ